MAEKGTGPKKAAKAEKPAKADAGVLAGLSSTRPSRLSRRGGNGTAPAKPAAARKPPAVKAPRKPRPEKVTQAAADVAQAAEKRRPRAVRAASEPLKEPIAEATARREEAPAAAPRSGQSAPALVGTVVQAAGELAQIGLTVSGQILKRAVDRLPRRQ